MSGSSDCTIVLFHCIGDDGYLWANVMFKYPDEHEELVEELCALDEQLPSCAAAHLYKYEEMHHFNFTTKEDAAKALELMNASSTNDDGRSNYISVAYLLSLIWNGYRIGLNTALSTI